MPAGTNAGGQLNLYIFEVVCITRDPFTDIEKVVTVGIHPLVVVPATITTVDTSRTAVVQTSSDSVVTRAGRAFRRMQMAGSWGVESTGLLPYIGTGEVRAQRFLNEVVRMSDAIEKKQVDECVNILTGTPLIKLLLAPYYAQPENSVFAINFYDFWHDRKFQAVLRSYQDTLGKFSATGLINYSMSIEECGPLVTGSNASRVLGALFDGLTTWNQFNQVLESYNVQVLVNSAFAVAGIGLTQLDRSLDAVVSQIDAVTGLLGGFQDSSNDSLTSFLATSAECDGFAEDVKDALDNMRQPRVDANATKAGWDASADADAAQRNLWLSDRMDELDDLQDSLRWQQVAGVLFGMSRADYRRYVSAGGSEDAARRVRGSMPHAVDEFDTEGGLEDLYGISFDDILARNDLDPDDALLPGRILEIPRDIDGQRGGRILDLPTFGSHVGRDAWGSDATPELEVDEDGDIIVIDGPELLIQGVDWLVEDNQDDLARIANDVPDIAVPASLRARMTSLLLTDARISSVDDVDVTAEDDGLVVEVVATAINGGTIDTGART